MSENLYILCGIGITSLVTVFLRFAPFVVFRRKTPQVVLYLGKVLPEAIMAMLVVYCLKNVSFTEGNRGLPEIIALALVVGLHKWKHNTLLSILGGTVGYMILVQMVFTP
ncbi:MAG: AzlD domain-containing protein [Clostridiales bacterium]|nr:AzlD domain-containing protein [Clostridiales bacterium]